MSDPEVTFCHVMDYHKFHTLEWFDEPDTPYHQEGFEVILPFEVMHMSRIAMIEDWLRENCLGSFACLVIYNRGDLYQGLDYRTMIRFSDGREAMMAKLRWG